MKFISLFKKELIVLVAIFFLSLFLRVNNLTDIPHGFHRDEVINAYAGRFILLNGHDLYGNAWPLFYFDKFGDYPPILPMYIVGLSTFILGVTEFASRFPAALVGALLVFPVFSIAKDLYKRSNLALLSALFIAIIPWHIVLSRSSSEGILAVTCFTTGLAFLVHALQTPQRHKLLYFSAPFFLLTYFLYPSFRIITPLALLPLPFFASQKKTRLILSVMVIIAFGVTFAISSTHWGKARFLQTSILKDTGVLQRLEIYNNDEGANNIPLARFFHNKIVGYSKEFVKQYTSYFSTDLLFVSGGIPYEYPVPDMGLLYVSFGVLLAGLLLPSLKIQNYIYYYVLYLLFIAPLPGALTTDFTPHIHRTLFMTVPFVLLLPYGYLKILTALQNKKLRILFTVIFFVALILETVYFFHQYYHHTASFKSFFKNDGYREVALYLKANKNKYKKVVVPYASHPIYYLYFANNFDKKYIGKFYNDLQIDRIENIEFKRTDCPSDQYIDKPEKGVLMIDDGSCLNQMGKFTEIYTLNRRDSTLAYKFLISK